MPPPPPTCLPGRLRGGRREGRTRSRAGATLLLAVGLALAGVLAPAVAAGQDPARAATAPADPDQPLLIRLDSMLPAAVPDQGPVRVTGTVTNRSEETWDDVNLYAFSSAAPMTTAEELAAAVETDPEVEVGARVIRPGTFEKAGDLDPGESAGFSLRVPREALSIPPGRPGVYWFGVHALGTGLEGRSTAGRARTFVAQMADDAPQLPVSLVLPVRRPVVHEADGRVDLVDGWITQLSPGGRLRRLLDFASADAGRALTWLVDPAVLAAVDQLAAGNPPRSLSPTLPEETEGGQPEGDPGEETTPPPTEGATPGEDADGDGSPDAPPETDETDGTDATGGTGDGGEGDTSTDGPGSPGSTPVERRAAKLAELWSNRVDELITDGEVLALPWGDVDVAAALAHDRAAYARATAFSAEALQSLGVDSTPAFAPPTGYADPATVGSLVDGATTLLAEDAVDGGDSPGSPVRDLDDRPIVLSDAESTAGGPGPDATLGSVQVRQRLLAETAIRSLAGDESPMVSVLPQQWVPSDPRSFFLGLDDAPWVRLATLGAATAGQGEPIEADALRLPDAEGEPELGADNLESVDQLTSAGTLLQDVLPRNDQVGGTVAREALGSASYTARAHRIAWRRVAQRSRAWIDERLAGVRVEALGSVTLSSEEGQFPASIVNELGEPVTVRLEARTDGPVRMETPAEIDLAPDERTSVLLTASSDRIGLYDVDLVVTSVDGVPLGASTQVSIRSAQVSWIIWVVIAGGGTLLFGAIAVRLVRRIRRGEGIRRSAHPDRPGLPA